MKVATAVCIYSVYSVYIFTAAQHLLHHLQPEAVVGPSGSHLDRAMSILWTSLQPGAISYCSNIRPKTMAGERKVRY